MSLRLALRRLTAPRRRPLSLLFTLAALLWLPLATATPPQRVVSINLCTDQLALLLAKPGQLVSVTHLAHDPRASALAERAAALPSNSARVEEIMLLKPDLILAGSFSDPTKLALLERLGFSIERFAPAQDFAAIEANLRRMGGLLGRAAAAEELIDRFRQRLAAAARASAAAAPLATTYDVNSYLSGRNTLTAAVVEAAGFAHLGSQLGLEGMAQIPLELLVLHRPDALITHQRWYGGPTVGDELLRHPALQASAEVTLSLPSRYWICGTPAVVEAVTRLAAQRELIGGERPPYSLLRPWR